MKQLPAGGWETSLWPVLARHSVGRRLPTWPGASRCPFPAGFLVSHSAVSAGSGSAGLRLVARRSGVSPLCPRFAWPVGLPQALPSPGSPPAAPTTLSQRHPPAWRMGGAGGAALGSPRWGCAGAGARGRGGPGVPSQPGLSPYSSVLEGPCRGAPERPQPLGHPGGTSRPPARCLWRLLPEPPWPPAPSRLFLCSRRAVHGGRLPGVKALAAGGGGPGARTGRSVPRGCGVVPAPRSARSVVAEPG